MQEVQLQGVDARSLGARLRLAREARAMTQQDVADSLGMARTTMVAIEKGDRRLKPKELVRLAELYDRRLSELLRKGEPSEGFTVQLRGTSLPSAPVDVDLLPHIDEFERLCTDYVYLESLCGAPLRQRYPPEYEIRGIAPELAAEDLAMAERGRLGLGEGPLLNLREVLDSDVGLRVFQPALPPQVAGMFAYTETFGGCIAVNVHHPPERRRHSLAHELGHFLVERGRSEILYAGRYKRQPAAERFAEAFGRAFLMPAEGLRRRFLDLQRERNGAPTYGDLCRLAHFFAVSLEAMTRRLEEQRLIPVGVWERLRQQGFKVGEARKLLELPPQPAEESLLPPRFVALAVEAWQRAELSEGQLAAMLRTDRLGARRLIDQLQGAESYGEEAGSTIDLTAPLLGVG